MEEKDKIDNNLSIGLYRRNREYIEDMEDIEDMEEI